MTKLDCDLTKQPKKTTAAARKRNAIKLQCMECGRKFSRMLTNPYAAVECPRCGSIDIDLEGA